MERILGTKPLNAPHIGIRNQVSNIGLSKQGLNQVIGTYIRKCLYLSCRELQGKIYESITPEVMGFNANEYQIDSVRRALKFKEQDVHRGTIVKVSLDDEDIDDGITRYLLFNRNPSYYTITPKNKKALHWNPIDTMNGGRYTGEDVFAKIVHHPRYMAKNKLSDIPSTARAHTSVSSIFRKHLPELKQMVKEALVGELNGRR